MIQALRGTCVQGRWNDAHSIWTTADGAYKIVRRFPSSGKSAAWMVRRANAIGGGIGFKRFSEARRAIAVQVKKDAGLHAVEGA